MFLQELVKLSASEARGVLDIAFKLTDYLNQLWNLFMVFSGVVVGWRLSAKEEWGGKQKVVTTILYLGFVVVNATTLYSTYGWLGEVLADLRVASAAVGPQTPHIKAGMLRAAVPFPTAQFIVYVVGAATVLGTILFPFESEQRKRANAQMKAIMKAIRRGK